MHVGGFNFAPTDKEWRPTPRTMDAVSKESLRQAFDEYLRGPSEVNITKPPHSVYPHYVHDDAQMEARLETFDGFRINYAEPCEIAGGTIVSNLVGISLYSPFILADIFEQDSFRAEMVQNMICCAVCIPACVLTILLIAAANLATICDASVSIVLCRRPFRRGRD